VRRNLTIIAFLSLVLLASCKKDKEASGLISSVVVDYTTKQPLPGAKIYFVTGGFRLYDPGNPWGFYNADTTTGAPRIVNYYSKDSTVSDANGRFSYHYTPVQISQEPSMIPHAIIGKPGLVQLFTSGPFGPPADTLFTDPISSLTINVQKGSPAVATDTVYQQLTFLHSVNFPALFELPGLRAQVGRTNTTYFLNFSYARYSKVKIEWRHYKNGLQNSGIDTVTLNPYSNTTVNINY
jgi:hypothetical protein